MEELQLTKARIRYTGIFDMGDYYKLLYDLFRSMGYDVEEQKYKHKVKPEGDEIELEWHCFKKVDDYSRYRIFARTLVQGLQKVRVQVEGATATKNKGMAEVEFKAFLQTDYENRWEINPILKFLKGIYDMYIYRSSLLAWKERLATELHTVENETKAFFNMQRFM